MSKTFHLIDDRDPDTQAIRVFLATPVTGDPKPVYNESIVKTIIALEREGIGWEWCLLKGNCHVDDARNTLVRNFRGTKCTHLFFLDGDNGWQANDLIRYLKFGVDFAAGIYPFKSFDETEWPVNIEPGEIWGHANPHAPEGLVPVLRAPTGFMCLTRSCVETMVEKFGDRRYKGGDHRDDLPFSVILFERTYGVDPTGKSDGPRRWGGDYAFCNLWRSIGGQIWVDPTINLKHQGDWTWEGNVGAHWKKKTGQDVAEAKARLDLYVNEVMADPVKASTDIELLMNLISAWNNPWGIPPDQLSVLMTLALETSGPTLECGSGLSTIVLAAIAKAKGRKHYALEHSEWYSAKNTVLLRRYGLAKHCDIIPAPLQVENGREWYMVPATLPKVSLLFVDGPPQEIDVCVRWLAIERLKNRLLPGAVIMADDVDQKGLRDHLPEWERELGCKFTVCDGKPRAFAIGKLPAAEQLSAAG